MTECKIRGPYLPVGDTDWECVRHEVNARLKEEAQARINAGLLNPNETRKSDFYCPVGRIVESLAELGAVSEEQVEEIITSVLEEERIEALIQDPTTYGTNLHELIETARERYDPRVAQPVFESAMEMMRFWEAGSDRPVIYGGDANQRAQGVRGMRAQGMFIDELAEIAPVDPTDLIGAKVSLTIQGDVAQFARRAAALATQTKAMKAVRKRAR